LPARLQAAIDYTAREHHRNGASRLAAPARRKVGQTVRGLG
jgi:hypothetical protein